MARMIVRATEAVNNEDITLNIPENYEKYAVLITDFDTLNKDERNIVLKVFTSGIISGFTDGSFGFDKKATRAEASAIMMRFLDKERRKGPILPETVDCSNTLTVEEFTTQLLKAMGQEATMDYAFSKKFVRYEDVGSSGK